MRKFMLIAMVIILSKLSFAYADNSKWFWIEKPGEGSGSLIGTEIASFDPIAIKCERITTGNTPPINRLKDLVGKTIYRDVPAQNETKYDTSYQDIPYEIDSYNENIVSLRDKDRNLIVLPKDLWDDGNWKEWTGRNTTNSFNIGDKVQTNSKYNEIFGTPVVAKIVDITTKNYPHNEIVTLDNGEKLDTDWLEKYNMSQTMKKILLFEKLNPIKKRLLCTKLIGSETFHMDYGGRSKYNCVECGHWLKEGAATNYYYCTICCTGFCIEEKDVAVLSTKKQNGVVSYGMTDFHVNCSSTYLEKYDLKKDDHVVWDKKCGRTLVFDMNNATVAYYKEKSSPHYCRATDEVEFIGANNLTKSDKCFKYPSNESEKYDAKTINKWYVGQEVCDVLKGRGVVVCTSVIGGDDSININVRFDTKLFADWHDVDTYTLSGKYKENQAQRLFPVETKSVIFDLDKLFPKK